MIKRRFLNQNSFEGVLMAQTLASVALLSFALISQYGFHLHPCELCLAQRYPYALIIIIGIVALLEVKTSRVLKMLAIACALLFVADAGIAIYHAGVEAHIFPGPSGCTNNDKPGETLEEMRAAIMNAQLVPCDQPMTHFLGLSMAAWNAVAAIFCTLGSVCGIQRSRKAAA